MEDFIKEYWEAQSLKHKESYEASWGDYHAINLEMETIGAHIRGGEDVLDIGCGNGFAALHQWDKHNLRSIEGIDFSSNMIKQANRTKEERKLGEQVLFKEGDIRSLQYSDQSFDLVYTTRVIINLPNWEQQKMAVEECLRVTKTGGITILSEAFWEPLVLLNSMRALVGLPSLVEHDFNRYLKKQKLEEFLDSRGLKYEVNEFSSVYYLGSRFLRELVTDAGIYPGYTNPINQDFYLLEKKYSGGGLGIQQAYVIYK